MRTSTNPLEIVVVTPNRINMAGFLSNASTALKNLNLRNRSTSEFGKMHSINVIKAVCNGQMNSQDALSLAGISSKRSMGQQQAGHRKCALVLALFGTYISWI